jgi:hypothetical protein
MFPELGLGRAAEVGLALHASAALDRYQGLMSELIACGGAASLHRRATDEIEALRKDCASLPGLSVAVVELSISHAELMILLLKADLLADLGDRCLRQAIERNQQVSDGLRGQIAHIVSRRIGNPARAVAMPGELRQQEMEQRRKG